MMSGAKHSVKVLKHDSDRKYVELELNGEKVRAEHFPKFKPLSYSEKRRKS